MFLDKIFEQFQRKTYNIKGVKLNNSREEMTKYIKAKGDKNLISQLDYMKYNTIVKHYNKLKEKNNDSK